MARILPTVRLGPATSTLVSYAIFVALSVYLTNWRLGGLPVRSLFALGIAAFAIATQPQLLLRALSQVRYCLIITAFLGVLGISVSIYNRIELADLISQVVEIYVQSAITVLIAGYVTVRCGPRLTLATFVAVVGLSALISIGQFAGFGPAWAIKGVLAAIQGENTALAGVGVGQRAMGLSLSKTILATQTCLAFAAYAAMRFVSNSTGANHKLRFDYHVAVALAAFVIVGVAGGNRSPLLGAALFVAVYGMSINPVAFGALAIPLCVLAFPAFQAILPILQDAGLRVASTEDKSIESRGALLSYGLLLFRENPIGYGLAFQPTSMWALYWSEIANIQGAANIRVYPLHNYALSMFNVYGVGLLLLLPSLVIEIYKKRWIALFFVPYIIHIAFHNAGPFWSDSYIWFVVGAIPTLSSKAPTHKGDLKR